MSSDKIVAPSNDDKEDDVEKIEEKKDLLTKYIGGTSNIVEERIYNIPLWMAFRRKRGLLRAKKAVRFLIDYVSRHMKNPNVKVAPEVNKIIWSRGIRNPPRRITVRVIRTTEEEVWILPVE